MFVSVFLACNLRLLKKIIFVMINAKMQKFHCYGYCKCCSMMILLDPLTASIELSREELLVLVVA